eukprot:8725944-Karenia_brevis.AAC.1
MSRGATGYAYQRSGLLRGYRAVQGRPPCICQYTNIPIASRQFVIFCASLSNHIPFMHVIHGDIGERDGMVLSGGATGYAYQRSGLLRGHLAVQGRPPCI